MSQASQMCSACAAYAGGNSPNIKLSHGPVNKSFRSDSAKISKSGQGPSKGCLILGCH
jgi:hypothetical protein